MRKMAVGFILITISYALIIPFGEKSSIASEKQHLTKMMALLDDENITIHNWSLHARENVSSHINIKELEQKKQFLLEKYSHWNWETTHSAKGWKLKATKKSPAGYEENIQLITIHTNKNDHSYMIYEVNGNTWNKETIQFVQNEWPNMVHDIFRENATIFTCVSGHINDMIDSALPNTVNDFLNVFQAKEVESINEENFISISANSHLFSDSIDTKNQPINLQLGFRSEGLGARTTFVVGTPIITIEY